MAELKERLSKLKNSQAGLIQEYEDIIRDFESHDYIMENEVLRNQITQIQVEMKKLKHLSNQKIEENEKLRFALKEQMMDERFNLLKISRSKLNTYFADASKKHTNRLTAIEADAQREMNQIWHQATKQLGDERAEIKAKLAILTNELEEKIRVRQEAMAASERQFQEDVQQKYEQLASEELSEEAMQKRMKQNQLEMKIGLSWMNKIGILLILFGVGAAFKFSYSSWFNVYMKGASFFFLGALFLAGGAWLYRRNKKTFALGLLGGGISVLYGSIFYSYFLLEIFDLTAGILLSIAVTVIAVLLSLRYQSQTVCTLALIGGYLPFFSYIGAFGLEGGAVYVAMGYLFLLNLFILLISIRQRWNLVNYISFLFHMPSMIILVFLASNHYIGMFYTLVAFLLYLGITFGYSMKHRLKLNMFDVILLALNTCISCVVLFQLFIKADLADYRGVLALAFCLVYVGLGRYVDTFMLGEKYTRILFYGTALTFAILVIPFQFGVEWLSFGWLVEGIVLMLYGHRGKSKYIERAGWGIFLLCIWTFFFWDALFMKFLFKDSAFFVFKYSAITLALLIVTIYYLIQYTGTQLLSKYAGVVKIMRIIAITNLWIYLIYITNVVYIAGVSSDMYHYYFFEQLIAAFVTLSIANVLPFIRILYDRAMRYLCYMMQGIGCLIGLSVTLTTPALQMSQADNGVLEFVAVALIVAFNLIVLLSGQRVIIAIIRQQGRSMELYPIIVGIYVIGMMTALLIVQFQLGHLSLLFSVLYLVLAVAYIMYGFRKKYIHIRRIGLGLTLFATGKLVFYDLNFLSSGYRIFAYFSFGVLLLGISYIYQKISNKFSEEEDGV